MSEQDSTVKMTAAAVIATLRTDYRISEHEAEYLLQIIRTNLKNLIQAIREAGKHRQWINIHSLNQKLEAVAFNLHWQGLQKFCSYMWEAVEAKNEIRLDSLIVKLPSIISGIFHWPYPR